MRITPRFATLLNRAALLTLCAFVSTGCSDPLSPSEEFSAAVEAAERWAVARPTVWNVAATGTREPRRTEWSEPCSAAPASGFVAVEARAGSTRLLIFFRCAESAFATAADLQDAFSHVVLEDLPHGLSVPNWRFTVQTPVSSFSEGVSFSAPSAGRIRIQIDTALYGVYGHSKRASCIPPADGPSAPTCYLFREHRIPLALTMTVPWSGRALD
jgi:hypothetical protein